MPGHQKSQEHTHDQDLPVCSETQGPEVAQVSKAMKEPSASSSQPLMSSNLKKAPVAETLSTPEGVQSSCSTSIAVQPPQANPMKDSEQKKRNISSTSAMTEDPEHVPKRALEEKLAFLVNFMLLNYQVKDPVTKDDILQLVISEDEGHFSEILLQASVLRGDLWPGVEGSGSHQPLLWPLHKLGLTYDGMMNDDETVHKTGLLILMLVVIFMKGYRATEQEIWEVLSLTGIHRDEKQFIFEDPKQIIIDEFVKEQYLEYQHVASSDPVQYEFLLGPRVHAETNKVKVLKFLAKVHGTSPSDFSDQYEETLLEQEERALARISVLSDFGSMATASSSSIDGSFSHV